MTFIAASFRWGALGAVGRCSSRRRMGLGEIDMPDKDFFAA
jgi:hypothetical protein